jgi:hypothetical protein
MLFGETSPRQVLRNLMGLQVLLLSVLPWLAVACSGEDQAAAPADSTTASATQATPAPSATPSATPDPSRPPLPGIVKEVADAIRDRDADRLLQLLGGEPEPCGQTPGPGIGIMALPTCPPGASPGTLVGQYIIIGNCEGVNAPAGPGVVEDIIRLRDEGAELYAVVLGRDFGTPRTPGEEFVLIYELESGAGRAISVKENGIAGVYYGCGLSPAGMVWFFGGGEDAITYMPAEIGH